MIHKVWVHNPVNQVQWEKTVDDEVFEEIKLLSDTSRASIPMVFDALIPVRTNNILNFAEDFFLPTVFHHTGKIQDVALRAIATVAAFIFDMLTLHVRFVTALPWVFYQSLQEENPLLKYLKQQEVDPRLLESDYVLIECGSGEENSELNFWKGRCVNFIDLPAPQDHYEPRYLHQPAGV